MFDLITGKTTHIPSRPAAPIVISTMLQAAIAGAVLVPALFLTGALPEPQIMMAFVAVPPPPPPPPPPALPKAAASKPVSPARPVLVTQEPAAPLEPPSAIVAEAVQAAEEGVPGGVEGGVPGGVAGGVVGGLPEAPPPPPPPVRDTPVRIGGQIQQPALVKRIEPIYPPLAVTAHVEGVVILEAIVGRNGHVEQVRVLRSANRLLEGPAIEAVKDWLYSPLILNGTPERFILTVVLSFSLLQTS